jgi:hypothetical protein
MRRGDSTQLLAHSDCPETMAPATALVARGEFGDKDA